MPEEVLLHVHSFALGAAGTYIPEVLPAPRVPSLFGSQRLLDAGTCQRLCHGGKCHAEDERE